MKVSDFENRRFRASVNSTKGVGTKFPTVTKLRERKAVLTCTMEVENASTWSGVLQGDTLRHFDLQNEELDFSLTRK